MPTLSWNKSPDQLAFKPHERFELELTLPLASSELSELCAALRALPGSSSATVELRHVVSREWTLFWKVREGESRSLLAHPELDQWVGTLALTSDDLLVLIEKLERNSGGAVRLSETVSVAWISNFDLILTVAG